MKLNLTQIPMSVSVMGVSQLCLLVVPARSCSFIVSVNRTITFWRACSLCGPSSIIFARAKRWGVNDPTRDTNKLYGRQMSCDYHYYQYTRPNLFQERLFNMKSCCGLQIPFTARTLSFGPRKGAF